MSFIQRTLKKAEDLLESFDENVANYSRKVALDSSEWEDDDQSDTNTRYNHSTQRYPLLYPNTSVVSEQTDNPDSKTSSENTQQQSPTKEAEDEFTDIAFVTEDSKVVSSSRRKGPPVDSSFLRSNEYKNQLAQVTKERNVYARQLSEAKQLLEELQFEIGQERKHYRQLEEEKDEQLYELKRKLDQVNWQLQQFKRESKDAQEAYQLAIVEREQRIEELKEECMSWQHKANHLQEELERKSQEHQDLNFSVHEEIRRLSEELEKEKTSHQSTRSSYQEKVQEWEAQLFSFQEKEAELEKKLFLEQQENKKLVNRIQELEYHLEMERNRCSQIQQQLEESVQSQSNNYNEREWIERVTSLSHQVEQREDKIRQLQAQVSTLLQEREQQQSSIMNLPSKMRDEENIQILQAKLEQMTNSLLEKQNQIESLRSTARVLSSQLDTERRRASQLEAMTADSIQHNNSSSFSTATWNESSNYYRPLRIRRAPRLVQNFLKVVDRFFALCLLILRREPLVRCSLFIYIFSMNLFFFLFHFHSS